jgi:hypothetical protein
LFVFCFRMGVLMLDYRDKTKISGEQKRSHFSPIVFLSKTNHVDSKIPHSPLS